MSKHSGFRTAFLAAFLLLASVTPSHAGDARPLSLGDYIRGQVPDSDNAGHAVKIEGTLMELSDTSMIVKSIYLGNPTLNLTRQHVDRLEVRTRPSRNARGFMIGLGVGIVVGAAIGYAVGEPPHEEAFMSMDFTPTPEDGAVIGGLLLGTIGAIVGTIVAPGAQWEPVTSGNPVLGATMRPSRVGAVAVKFNF